MEIFFFNELIFFYKNIYYYHENDVPLYLLLIAIPIELLRKE